MSKFNNGQSIGSTGRSTDDGLYGSIAGIGEDLFLIITEFPMGNMGMRINPEGLVHRP
jgi:hypothetical protein